MAVQILAPYGGKWRFSAERGLDGHDSNRLFYYLITEAI